MSKFYTLSKEKALEELSSSINGLSEKQAEENLAKYGKNQLEEKKKKGVIAKFFDQFKNLMIIVLLVAAVVSVITDPHEGLVDACIILFVVVVNAILGVMQESKAEKALEALKSMSTPFVKVGKL